jgi:ankyrin repeat protein
VKNYSQQGLVHIAAEHGFDSILVYLCKELDLRSDEVDANRRTPLHLAALHGNLTTASYLVAWGENLNCLDSQGNTPLHLAAASQGYKIVRLFIAKGANKYISNNQNLLAYDVAQQYQNPDILELLVKFI